jgi:hypothetical protein
MMRRALATTFLARIATVDTHHALRGNNELSASISTASTRPSPCWARGLDNATRWAVAAGTRLQNPPTGEQDTATD